jgi:propanol-preferring alcohol dehydrogenase
LKLTFFFGSSLFFLSCFHIYIHIYIYTLKQRVRRYSKQYNKMGSVDIPKKYKAAVYDKPGSISTKIEELDMPEPGAGEVLINLTHSGVCHSDMGVMMNAWSILPFPTQAGQVGGHEGVGKIVKMGPGTDNAAVKVGDRVGIKWMAGICEACEACRAGMDANCFSGKISGYYTPGTFQQYVLSPANYVTPIPDGLDSAAAAPLLCAGVTVYSALRKTNAESGNWVVISGAGGGLGHLAVQFSAKGIGHRVIGIDHSSKKDLVLESGAEHFIPVDGTDDMAEAVKSLTNGLGAHAVVVCTANNAAYGSSLDLLRFGGRVVCVGIPEGDVVPMKSASPGLMVGKALQIVGSAVGSRKEAIETMDFAARGIVKTHFRTEKMDALTKVFEEMHKGELKGRVVLDLSS